MKIVRLLALVFILILIIFGFKYFVDEKNVKVEKTASNKLNNVPINKLSKIDLSIFKNTNFDTLNLNSFENKPLKTSGFVNQIYSFDEKGCSSFKIFPFPFLIETYKDVLRIYSLERITTENTVFAKLDNSVQIEIGSINSCFASQDDYENSTIKLNGSKNNLNIFVSKGLPYIKIDSDRDLFIKNNGTILGDKKINTNSYYIYNKILIKDSNKLPVTFPKISYEFLRKDNTFYQKINIEPASPFVLLPHQQNNLYKSINDKSPIFKSVKGDVFSVFTDNIVINLVESNLQDFYPEFNLENEEIIKKQLDIDMKEIDNNYFSDNLSSYWNGKKLFKVSNLLLVSHYLNKQDHINVLKNILKKELSDYYKYTGDGDKKYFIYYKNIGALQNSNPDFGHEKLNDTHFHFGYYIYASAILCKFDADFCKKNENAVQSLITSVASFNSSPYFPFLRHLSLYEGHSFASGLTKSGDGNNQESSSEAINFWYSSYLFNKQINSDNADIYLASYLLESLSAKTYYLNYYKSLLFDTQYKHKIFSIVWEGKNDFATWFSANPRAIYGIQFIPLSFGSIYLKNEDFKNILTDLEEEESFYAKKEPMFDDLILGYRIVNEKVDNSLIQNIKNVDSSNSKTWMYFLNSVLIR